MGTDNLHHKRKAKSLESLARRASKRSSYDRVLIVCEGKKTEPYYFLGLIRHYKINSANIEVDGSSGSSPCKVYERALDVAKQEEINGNPFDRVYCVFDKDSHSTYSETLRKISETENFYAANSVPCFEYWLLLHFVYTTKGYARSGKKSIADAVITDLKKHISDYTKGREDIFEELVDKIEVAKSNSKRSLREALINKTDNPSTNIHDVIEYLQGFEK